MKQFCRIKRVPLQVFIIILSVFIFGQIVFAQNQTQSPDRGFSPGKSYNISGIETISMQSGNLMLNVPLGGLPAGRGGMSAGVGLQYNSKLWDAKEGEVPNGQGVDYPSNALEINQKDGGWRYGYLHRLEYDDNGGQNGHDIFTNLVMPDGSRHPLHIAGYTDGNGGSTVRLDGTSAASNTSNWTQVLTGTVVLFTTDGTFLRVEVTTDSDGNYANNNWILYAPDGSRIVHDSSIVNDIVERTVVERTYDRNGNFIDVIETPIDSNYGNHRTTYIIDQLGRKVVIEYNAATNSGMSQDFIHSAGFNGTDVVTKVEWKTITVHQHYEMSSLVIPNQIDYSNRPIDQNFTVVNKIYIPTPNGSGFNYNLNYSFDYNADSSSNPSVGWGEVTEVILPSGASSSYEYKHDSPTTNLTADKIIDNRPVQKTLAYDLEYDGATQSTSEVWTYDAEYTNNQTELLAATTVTGPDGGVTREEYNRYSTGSTFAREVSKTVSPDGTEVERYYQSNVPTEATYLSIKANRYPKYEYTSITNNAGTLTKTAIKEYSRDKNGNVTEVKEYDWVTYSTVPRDGDGRPTGLPSGVTPARISKTEYYNDTPDSASTTYTDTDSYHLTSSPRLLSLAKSAEVQNGSGTPQTRSEITYDYTSYSSNTKGGNATETKSWDSFKGGSSQSHSNPLTSTNSISSSVTYDSYGNPTQTTDANGVQTTLTYGNISIPGGNVTGLYPTQTESASNYSGVKRTSTVAYDFYTGLATSATDIDNSVTSATEYDDLGRPIKVAAAVGTALEIWTQTVYDDASRRVIVKSDLETKGDAKKIAVQHFDQLGRVRLSRTIENPDTEDPTDEQDGIKVQTRYLTTSGYSYQLSSNPYRATTSSGASNEPTMGWTRSKTVNTGKHSEVETFSGATLPQPFLSSGYNTSSTGKVQTDIDGDRTLVTDQAGKQRISKSNALGQLKDVWEIIPTSDSQSVSVTFPGQSGIAYGYHTSYDYNPLNNLTTVSQGSQTRTFSYSSLSRLLTAANPESGTISYLYDNNGNLTHKTDARSITTDYTYDALNRVTNRDYSGSTPDVTYTYDDTNVAYSKGKLTKVSSSISETKYTEFDILGRVLSSQQITDGQTYDSSYIYNLSGALIEETYPSTRKVKNVLDNNGDLSMVQSKKSSNYGYWNYAQNFNYTAAGAVSSMQLGNFKWESTVFNSRLQPTQIALGSTKTAPSSTDPGSDVLKLNYTYNSSGQSDNNGNILSQTIKVPTVGSNPGFEAVQTYTYDSLNRIHDARENIDGNTTPEWKQTFTYDRFGNRNFDEANTTANAVSFPKGCGTTPNFTMCAADKKIYNPDINTSMDNRLSTNDGYTFDSSGNTTKDVTKDSSGNTIYRRFTYDAENKQTKVETVDSNGDSTGTIGEYFYDGTGKRIKKYVPSTGETTIFVYDASGMLVEEYSTIVTAQQDAKVSYLTNDHLGSSRINTDQNGAVTARHDYQPFGEEIVRASYNIDEIRNRFTSYQRDSEVDLDFAQARYHNYALGRFNSPDPIMMKKERLYDPQSINLYIYVRNNPLAFIDPDGKQWVDENGKNIDVKKVDGRLEVSCKDCNQEGKQFKSVQRLASLINESGSKLARSRMLDIAKSEGKVHLIIGRNTGIGAPGTHQAYGTRSDGSKGPLTWGDNNTPDNVKDDGFDGKADTIPGKNVFAEAIITLDEDKLEANLTGIFDGRQLSNGEKGARQDPNLTLGEYIVMQFGHESKHNLDENQVKSAKNGDRGRATYHKENGKSEETIYEEIKKNRKR